MKKSQPKSADRPTGAAAATSADSSPQVDSPAANAVDKNPFRENDGPLPGKMLLGLVDLIKRAAVEANVGAGGDECGVFSDVEDGRDLALEMIQSLCQATEELVRLQGELVAARAGRDQYWSLSRDLLGVFRGGVAAPPQQSVVYFVQAKGGGPVKIGTTVNIKSRLSGLQNASAAPLVVLATMPGGEDEERKLHRRFANARKRGEWFDPSEDLMSFIESLTPQPPPLDLRTQQAKAN